MNEVHFRALDLNLLRVLDALIEERSVTRAGARLGLSQSAVSHALNRLRYALQDELLVRGPEGMRPTPRGAELAPGVRQALTQLRMALTAGPFVPAQSDRRFTIACNDYSSVALIPPLMVRLRAEAPQAQLHVHPTDAGVAEALDAGRLDIAVGSFGRIPDRYASELLFRDTMVWAVSSESPAAKLPLTLERLAELPHLIIALTSEEAGAVDGVVVDHGLERRVMHDDAGALDGALEARGLRRRIGLTVPHALVAPRILGGTDMAALLPRRLAVAYAQRYRLALFDPPYPSPPYEVRALWHRDLGDQPACAWLRAQLLRAAEGFKAGGAERIRPRDRVPR